MISSGYKGIWIDTRNLTSWQPRPERSSIAGAGQTAEGMGFIQDVRAHLNIIYSRPIGHDLITLIGKRSSGVGTVNGLYVAIQKIVAWDQSRRGRRWDEENSRWVYARLPDPRREDGSAETRFLPRPDHAAASSVIQYSTTENYSWSNPALHLQNPNWLVLAHELIHAYHGLSGNRKPGHVLVGRDEVKLEELFTMGLGQYEQTRISENAIRLEHGLQLRDRYSAGARAIPNWAR